MKKNEIVIYQTKTGEIEFKGDFKKETLWANQAQIADLFGVGIPAINKHLKNIFESGELLENSVISILEITADDGKTYKTMFYNLDAILSVGYRVNSKQATQFRIWATKTLRQHILKGYTINKKQLVKNYDVFLKAVEDVKKLLPAGGQLRAEDTLELVKMFASTWFSLNAYDKELLPKTGATKKQVNITADNITEALLKLRENLLAKKEATELFGTERADGNVSGIVGNIFQSFGGNDLYPTVEEKATHLLYFMVKNHPFLDGNKRSGAFAFVWFLQKAKILDTKRLTPEALTALTLLVAESNPKDKTRVTGLILMLLKK